MPNRHPARIAFALVLVLDCVAQHLQARALGNGANHYLTVDLEQTQVIVYLYFEVRCKWILLAVQRVCDSCCRITAILNFLDARRWVLKQSKDSVCGNGAFKASAAVENF